MKSRKIDTVTNSEDHVRLEIFEGRIPVDEAGAELLRLERIRFRLVAERAALMLEEGRAAVAALLQSLNPS